MKRKQVKIKQSLYRHGLVLRLQDVEASRFQDNRHMKIVNLSAPMHWPPLPHPGNIPGTHFC